MKKLLILMLASLPIFTMAQFKNDVSLVVSPLKFKEQSSYDILYRRQLPNKLWSLRLGMSVLVDIDKEIRNDSITLNTGSVAYTLSAGLQRKLILEDIKKVYAYIGSDLYWQSEFSRNPSDTYYGYYWSIGTTPVVGVSYEPIRNIRLSLESRSDFNLNFQHYESEAENRDTRVSFKPLNQLAIGIGYLF
jgi:hypothetical protein